MTTAQEPDQPAPTGPRGPFPPAPETPPLPPVPTNRAELAAIIDHTLLKPDATADDVLKLCADAAKFGVAAVCVAPTHVYLAAASARQEARNSGDTSRPAYAVASVIGFPHGNHLTAIKVEETRRAVADGATEIDMVIDIANAIDENWVAMETEIHDVRLAAPAPVILKVILETTLLPDATIRSACRAALAGGADFVKTSTGFHPGGGASLRAVRAMHAAVGGRLGIKASGGIRTTSQALAFVQAGATRLGLSATADVLAEMPPG
ncbi:deoxyribose-phosphate aldolase [Frankia sp. CNm7]|uniref:Deoxyribose-phosphate aldolase n=1 Tax=Frankia nepalensis TaxID=1836974 RepID=A0A937RG11_9ACTN|nr:deoxyribose-phosphate aldolase [Frankia nepalensis]MBL7502395.1 deoxyribose-phosphate aldolase [Frankia nepalensis]MBL7516081.1 deoxyribose-phosphate aldolase [Frankia nepalensis]MBL7520054.1 deoxyribose-phosphate aldolase [Frankia nepalensis]MBL7625703.1 deoxyribose-phosphate aldolase [Frankia nepalensis]